MCAGQWASTRRVSRAVNALWFCVLPAVRVTVTAAAAAGLPYP